MNENLSDKIKKVLSPHVYNAFFSKREIEGFDTEEKLLTITLLSLPGLSELAMMEDQEKSMEVVIDLISVITDIV